MKRLLNALIISGIIGINLLVAPLTLAQDNTINLTDLNNDESFNVNEILNTSEGTGDENQQQLQSYFNDESPILSFIIQIIDMITRVIGTFAILLLIAGGLMMIVSEGDENRLQKGKGMVGSAIIGLVIALASYFIVRFIQSLFFLSA